MMTRCKTCSFELWNPYGKVGTSTLGLYSDARFPGRSILSLQEHYEQLDEVPGDLARDFMEQIQRASRVLREILHARRINVSILGNAEAHVHAHLIPRYQSGEAFPNKSPRDDPRLRTPLTSLEEATLIERLKMAFAG